MRLSLTLTEKRIANMLADAVSRDQIAQSLGKSRETIRKHISNILKKRGLKSSVDLAIYVLRLRAKKNFTNVNMP